MADPTPTADRLYAEPWSFDFFQAVRLLRQLAVDPDGRPRDVAGPIPAADTVRFAAHVSLAAPASAIQDLAPAGVPFADARPGDGDRPPGPAGPPRMTVNFFGLTGPSGVLPRHYTEQLIEREWAQRTAAERYAPRAFYDLFTHRFVALFYGAWEKYRFVLPFARGEADRDDPDLFTQALLSLVGLGTPGLRGRLRLDPPADADADAPPPPAVDDLGLFRFAGVFAQRHRSAWGLGAVLGGYFGVPAEVRQFQGRWLRLDEASQTRLPFADEEVGPNTAPDGTAVAGDRVWDVRGKFRVRLGPLTEAQFLALLPEPPAAAPAGGFALLGRLVRFYAGPEFDFDLQLVLLPGRAPPCVLDDYAVTPRLGWTCWLQSGPINREVDDPVFDADPGV